MPKCSVQSTVILHNGLMYSELSTESGLQRIYEITLVCTHQDTAVKPFKKSPCLEKLKLLLWKMSDLT